MANCLDKYICDSSDNCTVVITDENGVEIDTRFLHDGDIIYLNYEEREGYTFEGFTDEEGNPVGEYYAPGMYEVEVVCGGSYIANYSTNLYEIDATPCDGIGGTVTGSGEYPYGSEVELVATEEEGYHFSGWYIDGEMVSGDINYSFTVRDDVEICARFEGDEYYILAKPNDPNLGNATGTGVYHRGEVAVLSAVPFEGSNFIDWDNGIVNSQWNLTVMGNGIYIANFDRPLYTVTINIINESPTRGDMVPGFATGGGTFSYGTSVTLGATAYSTFSFVRWEIDGVVVGTDNTYSLTVTNNIVVNAYFTDALFRLTLHASPENGGYIVDSNNNQYTGGEYTYGTVVNVTATPNPSYDFVGWGDNVATPSRSFTMTRDIDETAYFRTTPTGRLVTLRINYNQQQGIVRIYKNANNEDVSQYGNNVVTSPAVMIGTSLRVECEGINGYVFDRYLVDNSTLSIRNFYMNSDIEKTVVFRPDGVCSDPINLKVDDTDYTYFEYNGQEYSSEQGVTIIPTYSTPFTVKARTGYYLDKLLDVTDENNPIDITANCTKSYCYDYYFLSDVNGYVTFYFSNEYNYYNFIGNNYYYRQITSAPQGFVPQDGINRFYGNTSYETISQINPDTNNEQYICIVFTDFYTTESIENYYFERIPIPSSVPTVNEFPYVIDSSYPDLIQWNGLYWVKLRFGVHFCQFHTNWITLCIFEMYEGVINPVDENSPEFVCAKNTNDNASYRKKVCGIMCVPECGHKYLASVKKNYNNTSAQKRPIDRSCIYWGASATTADANTITDPNRSNGGFISIFEVDYDVPQSATANNITWKSTHTTEAATLGDIIELGC